MAGYTTESKRVVNATGPVGADEILGSDFVGPEASWNPCCSLGSIFSCVCSIDGLSGPKGPASAWFVDVPFSLDLAINSFDGDSSLVLTICLLDGPRSSRDAIRSRL